MQNCKREPREQAHSGGLMPVMPGRGLAGQDLETSGRHTPAEAQVPLFD